MVNLVKIGYLKTCGFLKFPEIIEDFIVNIGQKMNKTAEVVCFGAKILTSIIHSLLLNEKGSIERHKFSWAKVLPVAVKVRIFIGLLILSIFC